MAITISGENNNDKILASDGVIDQISGFSIVGVVTATSFTGDLTGNVTGNLTGNVNSTSPLLLQTGGSERIRLTSNNEIGIAGANYGTSGQVLTSGGSGSAVSWTTPAVQTTIVNYADYKLVTATGNSTSLNAEANLTFNNGKLSVTGASGNTQLSLTRSNANTTGTTGTIGFYASDNHTVAGLYALGDGDNEGAHLVFKTTSAASGSNPYSDLNEGLRIASNSRVGINTDNPQTTLYSMNEIAAGDGNRRFIGMETKVVSGTAVGEIRTTYYSGANGNYPEMRFVTHDTERLRINSNGTVHTGMTGTAPSWLGGTIATREKFSIFQGANFGEACFNIDVDNANSFLSHNMYYNGGWKIRKSGSPVRHLEIGTNGWTFKTGADGSDDTGSALTQKFRIDASGNVTAAGNLTAQGSGGINISYSGADLTMNSAGGIFTGNGGNATNPIVANVSDTNTGFFYPAADTIAVTTGGSERLRITSDGKFHTGDPASLATDDFNITATGTGATLSLNRAKTGNASDDDLLGAISFQSYPAGQGYASAEAAIRSYAESGQSGSAAPTSLNFYTKPSTTGPGASPEERLRITSMGDVYAGNGNGYAIFDNSTIRPRFQFRQGTGTNRGFALIETRGDANSMALYIAKSREGNGTGVINSGDQLGSIQFTGSDGTNQVTGAQILAYTSGTIAADRIPTNLSFYTHPDSTQGKVERLRITSDGYLRFFNDSNTPKGLQWYNNVGGSAKATSIEWGNGSANWEFKHFRNDNQANNPYANIDFYTGSWTSPTRALRITNDGNHIREKHSRFSTRIAYTTGNESASTKIPFQSAHINVGSDFSDSNDRYTAPVDGDYVFYFYTNVTSSSSRTFWAEFRINGSSVYTTKGGIIYDYFPGTGWVNLAGHMMFSLDEGDYVEVWNGSSVMNYDGNNYGQWSGWLLG